MKTAIMQPYFFPYIGYFQLMKAVDEFVIYDNIQFTKKGWISRNRVLVNGADAYISLTLKKDSDYLDVIDRRLADTWSADRKKMLNRISESYRKAPFFGEVYPLIQSCILFEEPNLFKFIFNSLDQTRQYLDIPTKLIISSEINIDHTLKGEKKVIEICGARNAVTYINPIGGVELYLKDNFKAHNIELRFIRSDAINYTQFSGNFVPWLSIIDVLMFNSKEQIKGMLEQFIFE